MATNENGSALPKTFDPDTYYRVQLKKAVQFAGQTFSPGKSQKFLGSFAEEHRDSIASAEVETHGIGDEATA